MAAPHLFAAISPHGFGHLAQTAAVLNALHARCPAVRLTLRTPLSRTLLARRIRAPFEIQYAADDFGMAQHTALEVDVAESAARYRAFHRDWQRRVEDAASSLRSARPDLVLADVPYLTLAAAARSRIPSLALCCLNWADIYRHYCGDRSEAAGILGQMNGAYNSAARFLRTAPAMPMPSLVNGHDIGPVMAVGRNRRAEIDARHGTGGERLILVAVGGIRLRPPIERWPAIPGVRWVVQREWRVTRPDSLETEALDLPFPDLLASCDALVTKPGYGSFTEAAGCGVPVLYVPRTGWPEAPYLETWLRANGTCAVLSREAFESGDFAGQLIALLVAPRREPVPPTGIGDTVTEILARL